MTTKEIDRFRNTLDDALTFNILVLVVLNIGFICIILWMFGVGAGASSGAFAFVLLAILFAVLNHKSLDASINELWREREEALERETKR
jgi:hypothetical protein